MRSLREAGAGDVLCAKTCGIGFVVLFGTSGSSGKPQIDTDKNSTDPS